MEDLNDKEIETKLELIENIKSLEKENPGGMGGGKEGGGVWV